MGYRGKVKEQQKARALRAQSRTLAEIAQTLGDDPVLLRLAALVFDVDASRLRVRVYLHEGLDLESEESFWSKLTGAPREQFRQAHRAVPDASIRHNKHEHGCAYVYYCSSTTHRPIMGLVRALLSTDAIPG
jgi:hypothetical protein